MTNTQNTPAEVLESDYPVPAECYALRPDSGGAATFPAPRDLSGIFMFWRGFGQPPDRTPAPRALKIAWRYRGAPGANVLISEGGEQIFPGKINLTLSAGSRLAIRTRDGKGWGFT
jgi:N-methylhydantoinase B